VEQIDGCIRAAHDPNQDTEVYLGRQPILNRAGALSGYELLFRGSLENRAVIDDADRATARVLRGVLGEFGVCSVLNGHIGFVNVGRGLLMSDTVEAIPRERFVLEILEDLEFDESLVTRCHFLREAGYRFALDDVSPDLLVPQSLLEIVDIVKIDMRSTPDTAFSSLVARFRQSGKTVLAEKVETHQDFRIAASSGCELFQGYFFSRGQVLNMRATHRPSASLMRLLALLMGDPDIREIEDALKAHPDIVMHVLRIAKSGRNGPRHRTDSIRGAIQLVGTGQIARWIQLLAYAGERSAHSHSTIASNPLVQLVAVRARFMELAASHIVTGEREGRELASMASLTGMLSLMHVVFEIPCSSLLDQLQVHPSIRAAIERWEGALGALLAIAEAIEIQDESALAVLTAQWLSVDRSTISDLQLAAERWAHQWSTS
jgi:EAL and modified HD-GYP domain-containing signal transduction protein